MNGGKQTLFASAVFLFLLAGLLLLVGTVFRPETAKVQNSEFAAYESELMRKAVDPEVVETWRAEILKWGNRFPGSEGHDLARTSLSQFYRDRGFEVFELPVPTVIPVVDRCALSAGGTLIEATPFLPNYFQPDQTPDGGLRGRLTLMSDELLRTQADFSGEIAVLDVARPAAGLGLNALNYLRLGAKALVVTNSGGPVSWLAWSRLATALPVNYPRVYAAPTILAQVGKEGVLDLGVRYEERVVPTLVAWLKSSRGPTREAVVAGTNYDSYSLLPWHGVPSLQAAGLAQHLALMDGISRYRSTMTRDVIAIVSGAQFNSMSGEASALQMIGPALERRTMKAVWESELAKHEAALKDLAGKVPGFREKREKYVLERILYEKTQERVRARARFEAGDKSLEGEAYRRFAALNREVDRLRALTGLPVERLKSGHAEELATWQFASRVQSDWQNLRRHHEEQAAFWKAGLRLHETTSPYENLIYFTSLLIPSENPPSKEGLAWLYGVLGKPYEEAENKQGAFFREVTAAVAAREGRVDGVELMAPSKEAQGKYSGIPMTASMWTQFNHPSVVFVNTERRDAYANLTNPFAAGGNFASLKASLQKTAGTLLGLAHGAGTVAPPPRLFLRDWNFGGRVLVSGVGQSVLPNFPLGGALLGGKLRPENFQRGMGYYPLLLFQTDPYGAYSLINSPMRMWDGAYNLQAFDFGPDGLINAAKDEGASSQKLFRSKDLLFNQDLRNVTLVAFPASGVTLPDLINPQTLAPYSAVNFLQRRGLSSPGKINTFISPEAVTCFLEPDARFVVTFQAGSPDNDLVQRVRAFALGPEEKRSESEINGQGYVALDHPILSDGYRDTARSMVRVNEARALVQEKSRMLDPMTRSDLQASRKLLEEGESRPWLDRLLATWNAITYAIIVHPILRDNITEAVTSIIWYLCLLVPFVFFMERLVFGFSDIRRQLAAQAVIFLVSFGLLRLLHPAFGMIRSSLVILLGFVIFLICIAITVLFASKAAENLEPLRRKQGKVKAAEASTLGIMATAFLLGLNNMHRRKVRTGLTCGTLVLITFAMIAFTSIYQGYEEREIPLGPAAYAGLLVKKEKSGPISDDEVAALRTKFGAAHPVLARKAIVGKSSYYRESIIPSLEVTGQDARGTKQRANAKTVLFYSDNDPLKSTVKLLPGSRWVGEGKEPGVVVSDRMAETLGLPANLGNEGWPIEINGSPARVVGIFDSGALAETRELDGQSLLPFDIEALQSYEITGNAFSVLVDDSMPRVAAADAILAPLSLAEKEKGGTEVRTTSVLIGLDGTDYRESRQLVKQFVEQSGQKVVYGLDGAAWRAVRRRASSLEGLVDLLIPLVIAAVTVLNTMKGSVYERKDELAVYNAVGIASRYIFMMFFAEALVYAVVGSVLGYFLAQGVGAALTAWGLTGGLNMTFASMNSVYASLAVVAAVFLSTYFPARTAARIAAPSDESGWKIPEPEGDLLAFALPFVFDARERLAVLSFFRSYFANNTEGDGGVFQCSEPRAIREIIPGIACSVWLKPFDQGVSQELEIVMPEDPATGEFSAMVRLRRLSGTQESWTRLNHAFLAQLRRQFLHWRAVDHSEKAALFDETKAWFLTEAAQ